MDLLRVQYQCDALVWGQFLEQHPHASIFQSQAYYEAHRNRVDTDAFAVFIFYKNELVALSIAIILKKIGLFGSRAIVQSAPLFLADFDSALILILRELNEKFSTKVVLTQIRNSWDTNLYKNLFTKNHFSLEKHLNVLIDLSPEEDIIWSKVHRHRKRNIKKAEKGLQVRLLEKEDIDISYQILRGNYRRYKLPLISKDIIVSLFNQIGNSSLFLFGVFKDEEMIGTLYAFLFKNTLYCWYACSLQEYYKLYPNDLLHWKVMQWAKKQGATVFDFGGAGSPNKKYGVRDFKLQYGGEVVDFGRYNSIHHPILFTFAKLGFLILQKLKLKL